MEDTDDAEVHTCQRLSLRVLRALRGGELNLQHALRTRFEIARDDNARSDRHEHKCQAHHKTSQQDFADAEERSVDQHTPKRRVHEFTGNR